MCSVPVSELDGECSNTASGTLYEHRLSGLEVAIVKETPPRRRRARRYCSRLLKADIIRFECKIIYRNNCILCISPFGTLSKNCLSDLEGGGSWTNLFDDPCNVATRSIRKL